MTKMIETQTFTQKVDAINGLLRSLGRAAVQEIKMTNKNGNVIGQVRYGYRPQYVFDAVNTIIGPENWRYEVLSREIFDAQAVVEVRLFIQTDAEWICKGSQTGQMQIIKSNVGDAYKGAITDALQKCLSLLSIGCDAYKGLLKEVYLGQAGTRPRQQPAATSQPSKAQPAPQTTTQTPPPASSPTSGQNDKLPVIAGIEYQWRDDFVVATGKSYEKKELLKSAGFTWNKKEKGWIKRINAATH